MPQDTFHADLDALDAVLVTMADAVTEAMRAASRVLLSRDTAAAADVIAADVDINSLQHSVDDQVTELMIRRQPVAGDLRFTLASIRIATDLERMGDMAKHVAKLARRPVAGSALDATMDIFTDMSAAAIRIADKTGRILRTRNQVDATQLDLDDDVLDAGYSKLLHRIATDWPHGAEAAVDIAMLGRSYERFADHAVRVGNQVVFLVTGDVHLDRP